MTGASSATQITRMRFIVEIDWTRWRQKQQIFSTGRTGDVSRSQMNLLNKTPLIGQARQREMLKSATSFNYAETSEGPLQAHFFAPEGFTQGDRKTLVVFLHGGFWDSAMPTQFVPHCLHFAGRGAVTASVETRVSSTHGTGPVEALEDFRKFLVWLKGYESFFGVDPAKVVFGGAAGGACILLTEALAKIGKHQEPPPYLPAGLVLFSSLLDPLQKPVVSRFPDRKTAKKMSPLRLVRRKSPPMILFHGKSDRLTPHAIALRFLKSMRWRGNKVRLVDYDNADHTFFNFNVSERHYEWSLGEADRFLVSLGLLEPPIEIHEGIVESP